MHILPEVIISLLSPFERLFHPKTWRKAQLLAVGTILAPHKRTVTPRNGGEGFSDAGRGLDGESVGGQCLDSMVKEA